MDVPAFADRLRAVDARFQRLAVLLGRAETHGPLVRHLLLASAGQTTRATAWWLAQPLTVTLRTGDDPDGSTWAEVSDLLDTQPPIRVPLAGDTPGWQAVNTLLTARGLR